MSSIARSRYMNHFSSDIISLIKFSFFLGHCSHKFIELSSIRFCLLLPYETMLMEGLLLMILCCPLSASYPMVLTEFMPVTLITHHNSAFAYMFVCKFTIQKSVFLFHFPACRINAYATITKASRSPLHRGQSESL